MRESNPNKRWTPEHYEKFQQYWAEKRQREGRPPSKRSKAGQAIDERRGSTVAPKLNSRGVPYKRGPYAVGKNKKAPPPPDRTRDAIVFLKQAETALLEKFRSGRMKRVDRVTLYALLALDALTGGP